MGNFRKEVLFIQGIWQTLFCRDTYIHLSIVLGPKGGSLVNLGFKLTTFQSVIQHLIR